MEVQTRNQIILWSALSIGVCLVAVGIWYLIYSAQFVAIKNEKYLIAMKYPKAWTAVTDFQVNVPFAFSSPKETEMDTMLENLNVAIQMVPPDMTLQGFVDTATKQMTVVFKNMTVIASHPDKVAGLPAHRLVFETKEPDEATIMVVCFLKDGKAYTVTYLAQSAKYKKYLALVNTMVRSINFPLY